jgi:hypothetical protein
VKKIKFFLLIFILVTLMIHADVYVKGIIFYERDRTVKVAADVPFDWEPVWARHPGCDEKLHVCIWVSKHTEGKGSFGGKMI